MTPEQYRAAAERLLGLPADEFREEFQAWCDAQREGEFTRTAAYRYRAVTRRAWLQDADGTYYRNCPMIMAEQDRLINMLLPWRCRALKREWWYAYREGVLRTRTIGRFDRVAVAAPFREAYPDNPGLWILDEYRDV